jgi:hypothetical protein
VRRWARLVRLRDVSLTYSGEEVVGEQAGQVQVN